MKRTFNPLRIVGAGCLVGWLGLMLAIPEAVAQLHDSRVGQARIRLGSGYLNPMLAIADLGFDSNVFNESDHPRDDVTGTFRAGFDGGFRLGALRLFPRANAEFLYFQTYKDQQFLNRRIGGEVDLDLARLRPFASVDVLVARNRPGDEIDARVRRDDRQMRTGTDLRLMPQLTFSMAATRLLMEYGDGERFRGVALDRELNRTADVLSSALRWHLTPLTTWAVEAAVQRDRFDGSMLRNTDSVRVSAGFEFDPDALLGGRLFLGYRTFEPIAPEVPRFRGLVADAQLAYLPTADLKIQFGVTRDVTYSFEQSSPYYLATEGEIRATQRLFRGVEVTSMVRRLWMDYRHVNTLAVPSGADILSSAGGGVGYRLGSGARAGIHGERLRRRSHDAPGRDYRRHRIFGSFDVHF